MTFDSDFTCQNDGQGKLYRRAVAADFFEAEKTLLRDGYTRYFFSDEYENLCGGYRRGERSVYVYYLSRVSELRVIDEPYTDIPFYDMGSTVCDFEVINVGFDFSQKAVPTGGSVLGKTACGQSQVIILEDGSFIIIDGGANMSPLANTEQSLEEVHNKISDRLYSLLLENNKRTDGKIVIAAWIFTHLHRDHCTVFERFSVKYASMDNLELKNIIYNYPWTSQMYTTANGLLESDNPHEVMEYIADTYYRSAPAIFVPRTGQKIRLGSCEVEILAAYENIYPSVLSNGNDCSTVFRLRAADEENRARPSILFLGDIEAATSEYLLAVYGDALATPIVQSAHHGYDNGGTEALYAAIGAEHVIWTNSYARWLPGSDGSTGTVPNWIVNATDKAVVAYPQCDENERAINWHLTFKNGEVIARSSVTVG